MSTATNNAAWLTAKQARPLEVRPNSMPTPEAHEVIIKVQAISVNPVDAMIQKLGMIIENFPAILGCDVAGTVTAVGSAVTQFKAGDRVLALADGLDPGEGDPYRKAAFQEYTAAIEVLTAKIPDGLGFKEACVVPLCLATAANGLYIDYALHLPLPTVNTKAYSRDEVLVVWGVGSAVGSFAVQLAKASGYEVYGTASAHNFEYMKSVGVDQCFDYKKDTVADEILAALKGKKLAGTFNSVMPPDSFNACAKIAKEADGSSFVSTVFPPGMPLPVEAPEGVTFGENYGTDFKKNDHMGPHLFHDWIPAALANGSLKCKPDPVVAGQGLESLQAALDRWSAGVSANKIVVELP